LPSQNTIAASGQSFPSSDITIDFYQIDPNPQLIIKPAQAVELPRLTLKSDAFGNFSFSVPTVYATSYRFFASALFQSQPSPRSNPLFYSLQAPTGPNYLIIVFLLLLTALIIYLIHHFYPRHYGRYLPWLPPAQVSPQLHYRRLWVKRYFPWLPPASVPKP
jgi:hypothetical protein